MLLLYFCGMLSINNLSYFIGGRPIYENASLHIKPKDKIGLIGLNGKGKTTLLRLINGDYQPDEGTISKSKDCSIGFLNQDMLSLESHDTILDIVMGGFGEAVELHKKIEETLHKMEEDYSDDLVEKLAKYQEKFEALEGYTLQSKAEEILEGVGFKTEDLSRPLDEFSGGWRMRVMLARLLLESPSLLMLDEPTNHLDLPTIQWVENYLNNYDGSYIIVSHDREFVNRTAEKIVEVEMNDLFPYEGNYDFYEQEKLLRNEIQKNAFENQQQKIRQTERFIERFRAKSSKARQVQSKIKHLDKLDMIEDVVNNNQEINVRFKISKPSGREVVLLDNISKSYGNNEILNSTTARIERGDKIALIGANGKGKSTILRIINGDESIQGGEVKEGYNVLSAFYAQHQLDALHLENEILEELKQSGSAKSELELRTILGCFLFSGDDVLKRIKVLSGGEKSRVALAKTLITEANFLLLDEPTNHLDMISENILIQALQQYEGSFVVVSHNRHFISNIANKIWWIEDNKIKEYPGTYDEFIYWNKKRDNEVAVERNDLKSEKKKGQKSGKSKDEKTKLSNQKKELEKKMAEIESEISDLEKEKLSLESQMSNTEIYSDFDKLNEINQSLDSVNGKLKEMHANWENIAVEIDQLENLIA